MPTARAVNRRLRKSFKVGDVVTWGLGITAHKVVEVRPNGVVVDSASTGYPNRFVSFSRSRPRRGDAGPPRHTDMKPHIGKSNDAD